MKFDMKNIHTIFESAKSKNYVPSEHADKEGAKIDATLGSSDLNELFDNICPICGDVFASMKSAAADPKNLKITMTKTQDFGESAHIYIEAVEFATFCEAAELEINEAADAIKATCEEMVPGSQDSELHVVFPSECLNKGNLGSNRFGLDVNNDWAMQLMRGCRRFGISVNSGVEDGEPVSESAEEFLNEESKRKVYDKASWHIDAGENKKEVVAKFKSVFQFLNKKKMLNDNGKEILKSGIDESASIHAGLLTEEGCRFMDKFYDKVINESSSSISAALEKYYKFYNNKTISESAEEFLNEADISINGNKIPVNGVSDNEDSKRDYDVFCKNWKSILNYIAKYTYNYYKEYCADDAPVKAWKKPSDVIKDMRIRKIDFDSLPTKKYKVLTTAQVHYDLTHDVLSKIHDDHVPSCYVYIKDHQFKANDSFFDIMYDG